MAPAPALALREGEADVLRRGYGRRRCPRPWRSGLGSRCWQRRRCPTARSQTGRCHPADGGVAPGAVCPARAGRPGRRAAVGSAAPDPPWPDHHRDVEAAAEEAEGLRTGRRGSRGAGVVRAMEGLRDVEGVDKAQYDGATEKVGGPT
jgi:hypothetical protein